MKKLDIETSRSIGIGLVISIISLIVMIVTQDRYGNLSKIGLYCSISFVVPWFYILGYCLIALIQYLAGLISDPKKK